MEYPFTTEQFFGVLTDYNLAMWPAQVFAYIAVALVALFILKPFKYSDRLIASILASLWLWMGIVYHWSFFLKINPAAKIFGAAFVFQGLLLIYLGIRDRLRFPVDTGARALTGVSLMVFGAFVYPLLGYALGHVFPSSPTFGLPCPTTIFTFGALLYARRTPRYAIIIPFIWSVIGFMAAVSFGVTEDVSLLVAGLIGLVWIGFMQAPEGMRKQASAA